MRCAICTKIYDSGVGILSTLCGHVFHSECLLKWMDYSETCPECREPVSSKNISKLFFNITPNDDFDEARLEDDLHTLKAKLKERDVELKSSENKIQELKLHIANVEKVIESNKRREFALEYELFIYKNMLNSLTDLETEFQKLKQENENLSEEIKQCSNIQNAVTDYHKDKDVILREMQGKKATEIGNTASSRLATLCYVLKHELKPVKEEENQLDNEDDRKKGFDLSSAFLNNNEIIVTKIEEQLRNSVEWRNNSFAQSGTCTLSEEVSKVMDRLSVFCRRPISRKVKSFGKRMVKMSAPELSTSMFPFAFVLSKKHTNLHSFLKTGHKHVLFGKHKGKIVLHSKYHLCSVGYLKRRVKSYLGAALPDDF